MPLWDVPQKRNGKALPIPEVHNHVRDGVPIQSRRIGDIDRTARAASEGRPAVSGHGELRSIRPAYDGRLEREYLGSCVATRQIIANRAERIETPVLR
jgi:hypothetical protein